MGPPGAPTSLHDLLRQAAGARAPGSGLGELAAAVRADLMTAAFRTVGVELGERAGERLAMFREVDALCPETELRLAGLPVRARMDPVELWRFYLPVCQVVTAMAAGRAGRVLLGVAGPPGAGKSVFAALLEQVIRRSAPVHGLGAAVCGMDGFHFPNWYLESHFATDGRGGRVPLRSVKGSPETFDVTSFLDSLCALRSGAAVALPVYSRSAHDPVAGGLTVDEGCGVVIVEGNYLLLDEPPWDRVREMLDLSIFLARPFDAVREGIIRRHVAGGRSTEDAGRHFEQVDAVNFRLCMVTASRADLWLARGPDERICSISPPDRAA